MIDTKKLLRVIGIHDRMIDAITFKVVEEGQKGSGRYYVAHGRGLSVRVSDAMSQEEAAALAERMNSDYANAALSNLETVTRAAIADALRS